VQHRLQMFQDRAAELADDVRDISHRLHPSAIEHLGLPTALRTLVTEFGERERMLTTFRSSDVPDRLPIEVAGALYRIAQEALRNVSKHAGRTHVKVLLEKTDAHLRLVVRDFGDGFDMEESQLRGLGFISMAERARLVGGVFSVNSALGEGTTITVAVPLIDETDSVLAAIR
jgi:signal transduction histidine kinase